MEQKKFIDSLKQKDIKSCYLLHGEEQFLVKHYAKSIEDACIGKISAGEDVTHLKEIFDHTATPNDIYMSAITIPFFGIEPDKRRVIYVNDSKLFVSGRKADAEAMAGYLSKIPPDVTVIFTETDIDKRSKLFKELAKIGTVLDCQRPDTPTLSKWINRLVKEKGKTIAPATIHKLIQTVGTDMHMVKNETDKLTAYLSADEIEVTPQSIDLICTKTLESRIFDLIDAMIAGNASQAVAMYNDMLIMRESPLMVLTMIIRQFRIILLSKAAHAQGMNTYQAAAELKLRDFMVKKALTQGSKFTTDGLIAILNHCLEMDVKVKTGAITPELGVEMLIVKYGI